MAKLTKDQLQFLKRIGVSINQTFDATGLTKSERELQMKLLGKSVAFGVSPYKLMGHALKT